jgi:uncharacterized membrane protein
MALIFTPQHAAAQARARATQGWEVCNETSYILEAATGQPQGGAIQIEGWLRLRPGECRRAISGNLARASYFIYARTSSAHRGGRRQWGGERTFCVDPNAQFSFDSPEDCASMGLESRNFREVLVGRRDGWRTILSEAEPYSLFRARAAGLQRLLEDAGYDIREGRRVTDPRRVAQAIAQFRTLARLPANATEEQLIDALEAAARRRSNELGLTLCNRTESTVWTAMARRRGEGWESRGWWSVAPNACARVIDDALVQGVYYVHASMPTDQPGQDRLLAAGGAPFCTSPAKFAILGDDDCEGRYYDTALFSAITTRGRPGLVVEFFDRDFLPAGQEPRVIPRRPDAVAAETESQRQQSIQETMARRSPPPRAAGAIRPQTTAPRPGPPAPTAPAPAQPQGPLPIRP